MKFKVCFSRGTFYHMHLFKGSDVMQSFGGKEIYQTLEEKAANLLYFMVKNHPFTDGNKRSGAFTFKLRKG